MLKYMKVGEIRFPEIHLRPSVLHKARGYFANRFNQYDLLHNRDKNSGKHIYRYPAIQFKLDDHLVIYAFKDEAIDILKDVFLSSEEIVIEGLGILIYEKQIEVKEVPFGEDGGHYVYKFTSPWLPLNQKNYREYEQMDDPGDKQKKLNGILINNIIAFCKFAGFTVTETLEVKSMLREMEANLKGNIHLAFKGEFMVNFLLPDFLGLGKSSSRGYGNIIRKF
ncbi:MAG: DNA repair protein [Candidatus Aminicenantes bacterium]|nr:DNA repair protein [Candidatus Aminicenantes bacterium]NIM77363.1 DNA repair protein [Candidatus Aminicenantes bacterium]NIN16661.1 DNA repair protein [Candidatus Aminicenantes bacterium]NIN40519.1 DNA repair protein [Candidatus Aminicenantes bacterium]NIN83339.1 DNA repair protein [Candidatus Aminicenantes bacterium]